MKLLNLLALGLFLLIFLPASAKPLVLNAKEIESPPNRIVRTCCSFGSDLRVMVIPTIKVSHITNLGKIGAHKYLGSEQEGNGIIYTNRGGFIDLGHLRDQADWTAYLYALILQNRGKGDKLTRLGQEGGTKSLFFNIPANMDSTDAILLAGRIAYDLSVWHEIATWFGASYVPMVSERYSSFSVEDAYSNLLGVHLGIEAIKSSLPFEEAMTQLLAKKLASLDAVTTEAETYSAMEVVRNIWWTREKKLPSGKVLMERQLAMYPSIKPWLVPGLADESEKTNMELTVPDVTQAGVSLSDLYQLLIKPNYKFPLREIFPNENKRFITQKDFDIMLRQVVKECTAYMHSASAFKPASSLSR